jgi:hypothetical protein
MDPATEDARRPPAIEPITFPPMGRIETRLDELGLILPAPIVPPGNYELVKVHAGLAYIAGHGPFDNDRSDRIST